MFWLLFIATGTLLKQATIKQYKNQELQRESSHLVIAMRYYPRFLKKELRDEFLAHLAPEKQLLKEFNEAQKKLNDHNQAFAHVNYNSRFELNEMALKDLERLAELSQEKDVYLACVCKMKEMCHREILLLAAEHLFNCKIGDVYHKYPEFMKKL